MLISVLLCYLIFLVVRDKLFWHFLLILHSPPPPPSLFVILRQRWGWGSYWIVSKQNYRVTELLRSLEGSTDNS